MAEENSLGTAAINLTVNNDQMAGKVSDSRRLLVGLSQDGQAAFDQLTAKQKRTVESLNTQIQALGKSRAEILLMRAEAKNLPASIVADFARQLDAVKASAGDAAEAAGALSAAFTGKTFSDTQLYKANQSLAQFRSNAEAARAAGAEIKLPTIGDSAIYKANQALAAYREELDATRVAQLALAQSEAADEARFREIAASAMARLDAQRQQADATARVVVETDAQRASVAAAKAAVDSEASARQRAQAIMDGEDRARRRATSSIDAERAELVRLLGQIDPTIAALERLDQMEDQLRSHRGKTLSEDDYQEYSAQLGKAREALNGTTVSAGQTRAALRQLPAQFTDIATSLAAGQPAWLVFLQQGGQIKDSFGGIGPAIRGVLSSISPLSAGIGLAAGVVLALAAGAHSGWQELDTLNRAVIATGESAGVSGRQLDQMATQLGQATGKWSESRDAINALAASGKVAGAGLGGLAQTAVNLAEVTGQAADKTAQILIDLGEKPAETAAKLNEQYNFLTASQYARIQALEQEGRADDAARIAQAALGSAMADRAKEVEANAGWIVRSAHAVRDAWNEAWESVKSIGKGPSLADQAKALTQQIDEASRGRYLPNGQYQQGGDTARVKELQAQLAAVRKQQVQESFDAAAQAQQAATQQDSIAAQKRLSAFQRPDDAYSAEVKKANEDRYRALAGVVDPAVRAKINAEADAQIEKAKEARDAALKRIDGGTAKADESGQVAAFKAALGQLNDAYKNSQDELEAQRKSGSVSEADYYQKSQALLWQNESDQVTAIQAEIDRLQKRKAIGAERIQIETQVSTLTAQAAKLEQDAISKSKQLDEQQAAAVAKRQQSIDAYDLALKKSNAALQQQMESQVARIQLGEREYQIQQAIAQAQADQAQKLEALALQKQAGDRGEQGGIDQDQYNADVAALQKRTDERVAIIKRGYDQQKAAEAEWQNGLHTGYANWLDEASNAASQVQSLTTSTLDNFTDTLADAFTTGKLGIKDFATTFLKELARIEIRVATSKVLSSLLGGGGVDAADYSSGFTYSAKGNVYASPDLARYSNQVYDTPQVFAFAKGAGVFGEAGPEAIMPLTRDSQGRLGVRSQGGTAGDVNVGVTVNVNSDGSGSVSTQGQLAAFGQQLGQQMQAVAQRVVADAMRPGGAIWQRTG